MGNKRNGLLALLGLGAFAFWKYKNSTPEQQQKVKDQLSNAKDSFNKWGGDLKTKANDLASQVQSKAGDLTAQAKSKAEEFSAKAETKASEVRSDVNQHM